MHIVEELFKSGPGQEAIAQKCRMRYRSLLQKITVKSPRPVSGLSHQVVSAANSLLSVDEEKLLKCMDCLMSDVCESVPSPAQNTPTDFGSNFLQSMSDLLLEDARREAWSKCLKETLCDDISDSVCHWMTAHIFWELATIVPEFYLSSITASHQTLIGASGWDSSRDNPEESEFQQSVYYIGGSAVRSTLQMALRATKDVKWKKIVQCIEEKFLVNNLVNAPEHDIIAWTEAQDRGGLKYIGESTWSFLLALTGILVQIEEKDGSMPHEKVLQSITEDPILMMLWAEIIDGSLSDDEFSLLLKFFFYKYLGYRSYSA